MKILNSSRICQVLLFFSQSLPLPSSLSLSLSLFAQVWLGVQTALAWISILTNCLIFGFATNHLSFLFPSLFHPPPDNSEEIVAGIFGSDSDDEITVDGVRGERYREREKEIRIIFPLFHTHTHTHTYSLSLILSQVLASLKNQANIFRQGQLGVGIVFGLDQILMVLALGEEEQRERRGEGRREISEREV